MQHETPEIFNEVSSDEAILIEYLDGELPLQDRQIVEERLANEPAFRERFTNLEKSWQYLDLLEREDTDKDLLETSLETIVLKTEEQVNQQEKRSRRRFPWMIALTALLSFIVFFVAFRFSLILNGDRYFFVRVAAPIIERLDMYLMLQENDPDLELLRLLTERRVFLPQLDKDNTGIDPQDYYPKKDAPVPETYSLRPSPAEFHRRITRIEHLDETLYNQFYRRFNRLKAMDWDKKDKLREIHENIAKSPRYFELFQTLQNYYTWFKSLQSYEKAELRQRTFSVAQRADKIAELKARLEHNQTVAFDIQPEPSLIKTDATEIHGLALILENLDSRQLNSILDAPPEQTIDILNHLHEIQERK